MQNSDGDGVEKGSETDSSHEEHFDDVKVYKCGTESETGHFLSQVQGKKRRDTHLKIKRRVANPIASFVNVNRHDAFYTLVTMKGSASRHLLDLFSFCKANVGMKGATWNFMNIVYVYPLHIQIFTYHFRVSTPNGTQKYFHTPC